MLQQHKVCSRCGQRCVLTMPACGRCGLPFPGYHNSHPFGFPKGSGDFWLKTIGGCLAGYILGLLLMRLSH